MNILFIDEVHKCLQERLEAAGHHCDLHTTTPKEEILRLLPDYDGIVIRSRWRMDASFLDGASQLKFIARSGAGMENIDVPYCEERNIQLFNAPEGNRNAVGEHALGMLLSLMNKLNSGHNSIQKGVWDREGHRGHELTGLSVGLIGYGNNGSAFAKKLAGFDCTIYAYDKYKTGFSDPALNVRESDMESLFKNADVLSFHIPQTAETIGLFSESYLAKFQKPIWLINCARGNIVETEAVVKGLNSNRIKGACLDVLEFEKSSFENLDAASMPDAFKQLLASENVILSPHVAGWTYESYVKLSHVLADKILASY